MFDPWVVTAGVLLLAAVGFVAATIMSYAIVVRLNELHLSMNSRLDELLRTTGSLARAEGFSAGQKNHLQEIKEASKHLDTIADGK